MSLDTINTRANGTEIDLTWFNIIQQALGTDFVPRSTGVPTDQAGGLGTAAYSWLTAYLMTLKLRAATSGNLVTIKAIDALAASYSISLPSALPSAKSYLTIDSTGALAFGGVSAIQVGASTGSPFHLGSASAITDVCSTTITTNGGPVLVMLLPDYSGSDTEILLTNSNGSPTNFFYRWNRDASDLVEHLVTVPSSATMGLLCGGFAFIDPAPSAGAHTYKLRAGTNSGLTADLLYVKLSAKEL